MIPLVFRCIRYNCHKSLRLEAGVSYRRLRETTIRQHNWMVNRVNELTDFINKKKENPEKIVPTKKAIEKARKELEEKEPILHKYAIPTTHDITDHLIRGTEFGSFRSKSFPTAEEFIEKIGAREWFDEDYATKSNEGGLPTMNLEVIDIRPVGKHLVYDIEVDKIHSFLANGIVAHNCMISHGVSRFLRERLFDVSDYFEIFTCSNCGNIPHHHSVCNVCQEKEISKVDYTIKKDLENSQGHVKYQPKFRDVNKRERNLHEMDIESIKNSLLHRNQIF